MSHLQKRRVIPFISQLKYPWTEASLQIYDALHRRSHFRILWMLTVLFLFAEDKLLEERSDNRQRFMMLYTLCIIHRPCKNLTRKKVVFTGVPPLIEQDLKCHCRLKTMNGCVFLGKKHQRNPKRNLMANLIQCFRWNWMKSSNLKDEISNVALDTCF